MRIKICGVRTVGDAEAVAAAGVELAGLNFVRESRRFLGSHDAERVRRALGAVEPVGVFRDATAEEVLAVVDALDLRWIQLHGRESPETLRRVAARCLVIRAVAIDEVDTLDLREVAGDVAAFLVDGPSPGSGQPVCHHRAARSRFHGRPFFVAGGLRPDNVGDVVRRACPDGVDVATGVAIDGAICPTRLASFVGAARSAAREAVS